jgi:pSer/pThr/pTyr-binding forkhead associated (FHA) protein
MGGDGDGDGAEQRIKSSSSSSGSGGGGPATLKFKAPPKTMKFIPGKLVVAAGPDQGKEFRIAGHPTPEGNVVTMGRAEVEGERAFAHIQLGDTYRTVSRMQAEIVQKDQDIYLKNKSTTNPTMVNGDPVEAENMVELDDGDMIRMGEMMMRYERD